MGAEHQDVARPLLRIRAALGDDVESGRIDAVLVEHALMEVLLGDRVAHLFHRGGDAAPDDQLAVRARGARRLQQKIQPAGKAVRIRRGKQRASVLQREALLELRAARLLLLPLGLEHCLQGGGVVCWHIDHICAVFPRSVSGVRRVAVLDIAKQAKELILPEHLGVHALVDGDFRLRRILSRRRVHNGRILRRPVLLLPDLLSVSQQQFTLGFLCHHLHHGRGQHVPADRCSQDGHGQGHRSPL